MRASSCSVLRTPCALARRAPRPLRAPAVRCQHADSSSSSASPPPSSIEMAHPPSAPVEALRRDVVVCGGGVAAGYIARAFAEAGQGSRLALISSDAQLPYERPALTKKYLHVKEPARLPGFHTCVGGGGELQDAAWYTRHGIKVLHGSGAYVTVADLVNKRLATNLGRVVHYQQLVVATGAEAMRLPDAAGGALARVHYIRAEADVAALCAALSLGANVVIIGGGYIGMEVAAGIAPHGVRVTMVFPEKHVMPRLFNEAIATHYEQLYQQRGITILKEERVARIVGDAGGRATGVQLQSGATLPADLVVVGIGARPVLYPFEALQQASAPPGGIQVDGQLAARGPGVPDGSVYAVGDAACFSMPLYGGRLARVEHVDNARKSAAHLASVLLKGNTAPYDYLPFFYSRVFEEEGSARPVRWVFYGDNAGEAILVGDFAPQLACFWVDASDALQGVFLESGAPDAVAQLPALARSKPRVDAAALRAARSVGEALQLIGVKL